MRAPSALPILLLAPLLSGCLAPGPAPDVMASFYPIAFLASWIGGTDVTVGTVVPPGTEPHDYEPTVADLKAIADAKLLVIQGASFEAWLETAQREAPGVRLAVATDGLDLRENPDEAEADELPHDPHTWLDPVLYARMARNVAAAMGAAFPQHAAAFQARADSLAGILSTLDADFRAGLADCQTRFVVTNHAAFGYLAARYGFTMIAIEGLSPDAEPDPQTLKRVEAEARAHNVTVIFFEELVSPAVAETVAAELGAETRVLSPVEGIPADEAAAGANYVTKMRDNLAALRHGMKCT